MGSRVNQEADMLLQVRDRTAPAIPRHPTMIDKRGRLTLLFGVLLAASLIVNALVVLADAATR
jgi:hypothetical protein